MLAYSITFVQKGVPLDEAESKLNALFKNEKLTGGISGKVFGYIELQDQAQAEALKIKYPDLILIYNSPLLTP